MIATRPIPGLLNQQVAAIVRANVRALMVEVRSNEIMHAEIVAAGESRFRRAFRVDMGGFFNGNRLYCDDLADTVFRFFRTRWREIHPGMSASQFLDRVVIETPPTEEEIEDAWELEIGSSEAAMEKFYEGSARTRKGKWLGSRLAQP